MQDTIRFWRSRQFEMEMVQHMTSQARPSIVTFYNLQMEKDYMRNLPRFPKYTYQFLVYLQAKHDGNKLKCDTLR